MAFAVYDREIAGEAVAEGRKSFRPAERMIVVLGAGGLGAVAGAFATLALGSLEPWMVAACAAPFYLLALHLANDARREAIARQEWGAVFLSVLVLLGMAVWPISAFYMSPNEPAFWAGPAATLLALASFVAFAPGEQGRVYRASAVAVLVAVIAANQSLLVAVGA